MWFPTNLDGDGPRFLAILRALERDIAEGKAKPRDRLLPQRELAYRLKLSVGTVVRAYALAGIAWVLPAAYITRWMVRG